MYNVTTTTSFIQCNLTFNKLPGCEHILYIRGCGLYIILMIISLTPRLCHCSNVDCMGEMYGIKLPACYYTKILGTTRGSKTVDPNKHSIIVISDAI